MPLLPARTSRRARIHCCQRGHGYARNLRAFGALPRTTHALVQGILTVFDVVVVAYVLVFFVLNVAFLALSRKQVGRELREEHVRPALDRQRAKFSPLITLLVPAYNEEVTIVESIKSLLRLNYTAFEIVICNDESKDKTVEVLLKHFHFVRTESQYNDHLHSAKIRGFLRGARGPSTRASPACPHRQGERRKGRRPQHRDQHRAGRLRDEHGRRQPARSGRAPPRVTSHCGGPRGDRGGRSAGRHLERLARRGRPGRRDAPSRQVDREVSDCRVRALLYAGARRLRSVSIPPRALGCRSRSCAGISCSPSAAFSRRACARALASSTAARAPTPSARTWRSSSVSTGTFSTGDAPGSVENVK